MQIMPHCNMHTHIYNLLLYLKQIIEKANNVGMFPSGLWNSTVDREIIDSNYYKP